MGRFYKTDSATPLDYMYSINTPLMEKALLSNDQAITNNLASADKLGELVHYNYLQADEEDAKNITSGYTKQIDDISDAIRRDPANWKKQLDPMRSLTRTLQEDYRSGAISKHVANYNKRKQDFDTIDKQVDLYHKTGGTKGINPNAATKMKLHLDSQFDKTGYDKGTGAYNLYKGGAFMDDIDVRKRLAEGFDKLKADGIIKVGEDVTKGGEYFNKITNKWEGLTQDKLLRLVSERYKGDTGLQNYLKERSDIGEIKGVYDKNGLIDPYNVGAIKRSPEEQQQVDNVQRAIDKAKDPQTKATLEKRLKDYTSELDQRTRVNWNNDSYLAPILRGIVDQYSYSKTDKENDLSNNSLYNTKLNINAANSRQAKQLAQTYQIHREKEANATDRFNKRLDFDKYKWDNPHATGKGATAKASTTSKDKDLLEESGVEKIATNSFEDQTVKDIHTNADVPLFSVAGLSSEIDRKKNDLSKVSTDLANIDKNINNAKDDKTKGILNIKKQQLEVKEVALKSELGERRKWYEMSSSKALEGLPKEEQDLYKSLPPDKGVDILVAQLEATKKKFPIKYNTKSIHETIHSRTDNQFINLPQQTIQESPEIKAAQEKLSKYVQVKKKVDEQRDKVLETVRKDYITEDAIQLGKQDSDAVSSMLLAAPTGLQLYDNKGEHTSGIALDQKGLALTPGRDNKNFTFADGSLSDYIANSGTKMKVRAIGPTTGIGNGNPVARVRFEDPNGEIPKGKDYYIVMTPELAKSVATKFKGHKNPDIAAVGENIGDEEANNFRRQLKRPQSAGEDQKFVVQGTDTQGNTLPLNVTKIGNHLNVTFTNKDGDEIPLPSLSGVKGFFNNEAEFIKSFKAVKNGTLK